MTKKDWEDENDEFAVMAVFDFLSVNKTLHTDIDNYHVLLWSGKDVPPVYFSTCMMFDVPETGYLSRQASNHGMGLLKFKVPEEGELTMYLYADVEGGLPYGFTAMKVKAGAPAVLALLALVVLLLC